MATSFNLLQVSHLQVDTDDEEDEDAWRDDGDGDALDPNEADEAGKTAADVEAHMRQRDRKAGKSGFQMDEVDEQEIEEYYRNRYSSLQCVLSENFSAPVLFLLSTWSRSGTMKTQQRSSVLVRGEKR